MNIQENNKLIAEFMGEVFEDEKILIQTHHPPRDYREWADTSDRTGQYKISQDCGRGWEYRTSWDWLMPVVEKIEDIQDGEEGDTVRVHFYDVEIRQSVCTINGTEIEVIADRKIDVVYQAVVEFIKWYNENK